MQVDSVLEIIIYDPEAKSGEYGGRFTISKSVGIVVVIGTHNI
jgi:hypothetical protein